MHWVDVDSAVCSNTSDSSTVSITSAETVNTSDDESKVIE